MKDTAIISEVDSILQQVQEAQHLAEIKNAAKRQAERQEKMEAWQDPDAMAYRKMLNDKKAFESLQAMKLAGQCELATPVPPDSELPKEMRGQQPSTVRAWLRGNPEWQEKIQAFRKEAEKKADRGQILRAKYPEMFGIDDARARQEFAEALAKGDWKGSPVSGAKPKWVEKTKVSAEDPKSKASFISWLKSVL